MIPTTYKVNMNSLLHLAGIIAEVTTVLAAEGIALCSCVAEIDRGRGLAVMLFQIEANIESLVICPVDLNSLLTLVFVLFGSSITKH
jgi:hypothetical protein